MTLETDLIDVLKTRCPRVHLGTAPHDTPTPYITWQHIGGASLRYLDNSPADKRNSYIQINAWADTPKAAMDLLRLIEDDLCSAATLTASPQGEPVGAYDDGDTLKGALQSFSIWGARS